MTQASAIRITFIFSLMLLLCDSIVCAEEGFTALSQNRPVPVKESESTKMPADVKSAEKDVVKLDTQKKQPDSEKSEIAQARPGERVTNPDHAILNPDTTLGGVAVNGTGINDFGYLGPGDMRTHLWNAHSKELIENGITENKLMAMTQPEVQKWHNHFHGAEGSPEHDDHDNSDTIDGQTKTPQSSTYDDDPFGEATTVDGNYEYSNSGYPDVVYGESEIIYDQGVIIGESMPYQYETPMESTTLNHGVIESWSTDW